MPTELRLRNIRHAIATVSAGGEYPIDSIVIGVRSVPQWWIQSNAGGRRWDLWSALRTPPDMRAPCGEPHFPRAKSEIVRSVLAYEWLPDARAWLASKGLRE